MAFLSLSLCVCVYLWVGELVSLSDVMIVLMATWTEINWQLQINEIPTQREPHNLKAPSNPETIAVGHEKCVATCVSHFSKYLHIQMSNKLIWPIIPISYARPVNFHVW